MTNFKTCIHCGHKQNDCYPNCQKCGLLVDTNKPKKSNEQIQAEIAMLNEDMNNFGATSSDIARIQNLKKQLI